MTTFILRTVLREAQAVIEEHERVRLTRRDNRLVRELLENPPPHPTRSLQSRPHHAGSGRELTRLARINVDLELFELALRPTLR